MSNPLWRDLPRFELGHWPTPLEPLDRLSEELGGPRIWVKRDDCSGLAFGGNKTRKLEFLIGDALAKGADTVVTFGAVQSNHARQTAAACAKAGLSCHQVLSRQVSSSDADYESGGNIMLGHLLHAEQHFVAPEDATQYSKNLLAELKQNGRQTYVVPAGGSNALGALGYAVCAQELQQQTRQAGIELAHVIHASSSAGTQAGLLFGFDQLGISAEVMGINVYHPDPANLHARVQTLVEEMTTLYADKQSNTPPVVNVNHAYIGEGYGQPTEACVEAIRLVASLEGLLFDPVYSGKALAAMIDQVTLGNFRDAEDVLLIHTGGTPVLHVYRQQFA